MNGPADLGGRHGFGPVRPEANEPAFHAPWERQAMALTVAMGACGLWSIDRSRFMRESLPYTDYYSIGYYGIWIAALERLVADAGIPDGTEPTRVLKQPDVRAAMKRGAPTDRDGPAPQFQVGDTVRVRTMNPATHTRAPSYVRGRTGVITALHGAHVFPDTSARREGEQPTPLYTVRFPASELWGPDTTAAAVRADLFEPYLEAA